MIVRRLKLRRWDVSDRLEQSTMIKPVDPFQCGVFDCIDVAPGAAVVDHFGLVESDDRLREGIVVGIADAADRRFGAGFCQPFGVTDRQILGRFNSSSQHVLIGGCDEYKEAAVGSSAPHANR
jgi:hypothetical protein